MPPDVASFVVVVAAADAMVVAGNAGAAAVAEAAGVAVVGNENDSYCFIVELSFSPLSHQQLFISSHVGSYHSNNYIAVCRMSVRFFYDRSFYPKNVFFIFLVKKEK